MSNAMHMWLVILPGGGWGGGGARWETQLTEPQEVMSYAAPLYDT